MITQTRNEVFLEGIPLETPEWSHENHGTQFYRFYLQVHRLSGAADILPILVTDVHLPHIQPNIPLRLKGQFRSFNNRSGTGNKLILTVFALEIQPAAQDPCNLILLSGSLCKPPVFRRTPLGRSICDLMLAVPRHYGRADYLPVIAWGQLAMQARNLEVGSEITLEGRIQSRVYQKTTPAGVQERIAYEVSMMHFTEGDRLHSISAE